MVGCDADTCSENVYIPLVERLLSRIGPSDQIDTLWAVEAEARINAYDKGESQAIPAEDVFEKIETFQKS